MFSVVIPLYNKEHSITNTVFSVLNQSYKNFEILIINDGSTDKSIDAIKMINDDRIKVIHQKNQGVSSARNRGIIEAKYEWIAFLDGDDLWENNHLKEIVKMMNIFPNDKVYVTSYRYSDNRVMVKHERNSSIFKIRNYFKEALKESLLWTSIVVVHKNCFNIAGNFNEILKYGEDLDLWARLAKNFDIVKSCEITAIYRIDAENRTSLNKDLKSHFVYYLNIHNSASLSEDEYYKYLILNRLYAYFRNFYIFTFFKLKNKYSSIGYIDVLKYFLHQLINKFK